MELGEDPSWVVEAIRVSTAQPRRQNLASEQAYKEGGLMVMPL